MIKTYRKLFRIFILMIFILLASFSLLSYAKEGDLSLKVLSIESPFTPFSDDDGDESDFSDNFYGAISTIHPPVLVNYDNQKSLLLFVPPNKDDAQQVPIILI